MINKANIPRALRITPHKRLIPLRPLVLCVAREHALDTHAHAFDILHRAPACGAEQIEADDAVGVDVRVDWDVADGGGGRVGGCAAIGLWDRRGGRGGVGGCERGAGRGQNAEEDNFGWFWGSL